PHHPHARGAGLYHPAGRAEFPLRLDRCGPLLRHGTRPRGRGVCQLRTGRQPRKAARVSGGLGIRAPARRCCEKEEGGIPKMKHLISLAALAAALACGTAQAQTTVKVGVMSDMSSL